MDFLTFVSKAIESLAWPLVIVFLLHRHKQIFSKLLTSLTSLKIGEHFNATFSAEADKIAKESEEELPQDRSGAQLTLEEKLLLLPPRLAILDSWKMVENAIVASIDKNKLLPEIRTMKEELILRSPLKASNLLRHSGFLNPKQAELMNKLRLMRNKVVHGELGIEPTPIDAENYVRSAVSFVQLLDSEDPSA